MMVLFYVHCFVLLLWSLYPACQSAIDDDMVSRAKEGAWVTLRDSVDEAVVKVAKMSDVGGSFDKAEAFCKQDDSHLTSVLSENEMKFIGGSQYHFLGNLQADGNEMVLIAKKDRGGLCSRDEEDTM